MTAGKSSIILYPAELAFWERAPEQIHADLQSPRNWPLDELVKAVKSGRLSRRQRAEVQSWRLEAGIQVSPELRARVHRTQAQLSRLPNERRLLFEKYLTQRTLEQLPPLSEAAIQRLVHVAVFMGLQKGGPEVFRDPLVLAHLTGLWSAMSAGSLRSRKEGKDRWLELMTQCLPNLRRFKEKKTVAVQALETKVLAVRRAVKDLRRRRWHEDDLPAVRNRLRRMLPNCPAAKAEQLARAIVNRHSDGIERGLLAVAGHPFGLGVNSVRNHLAAHRNRRYARYLDLIAQGKQRYANWLRKKSLTPTPAVARLLRPPAAP